MDEPALAWTLTASTTTYLDWLNAGSAAMPMATWRPRALLRAREGMARRHGEKAWREGMARRHGEHARRRRDQVVGRHAERPHGHIDAQADVFRRRVSGRARKHGPRASNTPCAMPNDRRSAVARTGHTRHR